MFLQLHASGLAPFPEEVPNASHTCLAVSHSEQVLLFERHVSACQRLGNGIIVLAGSRYSIITCSEALVCTCPLGESLGDE